MKLELKHLSPYLNHKIQVSYLDWLEDKKRNTAYLTGISLEDGIETTYKRKKKGCSGDLISWKGNNNIQDLELKLLLRPLSDLNKEIEFNGEKFLPIEVIKKGYLHPVEWGINHIGKGIKHNGKMIHLIVMDGEILEECPLFIYYKLIKWHFDIFNLIENNLAININTLTKWQKKPK